MARVVPIGAARVPAASVAVLLAVTLAGCGGRPGRSDIVPGIPVYPGAELQAVQTPVAGTEPDGSDSRDPLEFYIVRGADPAAVLTWYREQMADAGWTAITAPGDEVVIYNDAKGCYAMVGVSRTDDGIMLQLSRQDPSTPCVVIPTSDPGTR